MAEITITVPDANVPEVRAAIQMAMGLDDLASPDDFKTFVRSHIRAAVLRYRETQQTDIDRTDPTEN